MDIAGLSKLSADTLVTIVMALGFMVNISPTFAVLIANMQNEFPGVRICDGRVRGYGGPPSSVSTSCKLASQSHWQSFFSWIYILGAYRQSKVSISMSTLR